MKGYKAFGKGLICKGKQYAENTVFEEDKAEICHSGMHFCENPFDVLDYYNLVDDKGEFSEFAEVEALADVETDDTKKYCTTKLQNGAKLSFAGFIDACINFLHEKTIDNMPNSMVDSGYYAQIGSSGNYTKIGSSGYYAKIVSTGEDSVICCAGHNSVVKAKQGSWITLSEWDWSKNKERYVPVCVKTEYVDGKRIKADTSYKLENGEFVEVE